MDIFIKEIKNRSRLFAKSLLAQAEKNEPQITADLQEIAAEILAEMAGLENKFKIGKSLAEKITQKSVINTKFFTETGYSLDEAVEKSFELQAEKINDVLRYTFILLFENYVFGFRKSLEKLKRKDYKVPENKIWNAWKNAGTRYDTGYRGINVTIISSQGQMFELQFHTKESFQQKMRTHLIYKEAILVKTSSVRKKEIIRIMIKSAMSVSIPKGITKI